METVRLGKIFKVLLIKAISNTHFPAETGGKEALALRQDVAAH